ncbi:MAG: sugar phosphate isomerase/epimerase [Acidobacteria bacterium]|nr:MAG: sugar phosphate isomerase/epimerase [Acidobacteriota bacterium]
MNRRAFVKTIGSGAVAVWSGSHLLGARVKSVGLQLYTIRAEMEKDFEGSLARVAQIGYREVEFAGYFGRTPQQVKAILKKNGLKTPSAHIGLDLFEKDLPKTIETAKILGQKYLICPSLPEPRRKTIDDWKKLAELFNRLGTESKKSGLDFAYHNHAFEFQPLDGQLPYDVLLQNTDRKLVKMEMDLYWVVRADQDPVKYFQKYPGRFALVHVKDMDTTPQRGFAEVGRGNMDFKKIFSASKQAGIKHYIVEQDSTPGNPFDSIKISLDYLSKFQY